MPIKPWDEWDSEHEQFIVLSYYGQTDFVFSIRKLPDLPYNETTSIHEEYLKRLKRAYREYLKRKGYTGYSHDIRLVWKLGLTDIEIESLLQDRRPVKQWLQNVALQVKEELESIVRFKAERMAELDDDSDSNGADSASVERPGNIPSFPIDSFSPVVPDGSVPVPFVASRKETVSSCTSEVKQPDDESTRHLRNIDKEDKQHTKQLTSIQTVLQEGNEITREGFARLLERLELQQPHATLKDAEQTPPPSPEKTKRENFKFPKDQTERIDLLWRILQDLKNGKNQTEISDDYGFNETLWTKSGKKGGWGLGQYLPKLKERALSYARDRKARLERRVNEGDTVDYDDLIDNNGKQKPDRGSPDWRFCAVLLGYIDEVELDPEKDINRREVPMGQLTDRGKWE